MNRSLLWRLWRALYKFSPDRPMFHRTLEGERRAVIRIPGTLAFMLVMFGVCTVSTVCVGISSPTFAGLIILLIAGGSLNSLHAAMNISHKIVHERQTAHDDLLSLTPGGMFEWGWAVAAKHLRLNSGYLTVSQIAVIIQIVALTLGSLIVVYVAMGGDRSTESWVGAESDAASLIVGISTVLMLTRIDYMHSVVNGVLVALIVPTGTDNRSEAGFRTLALFSSLQLGKYLMRLALLVVIWVLGGLGVTSAVIGILHLVIVSGLYEVQTRALWRYAARELNTDTAELDALPQSIQWDITLLR